MGYRIEYDNLGGKYEIASDKRCRVSLLPAVFFGLFLLGTAAFWPEGTEKLREWIIPGDNAVTIQAFQIMKQNLYNGVPFGEAVEAFCRYAIHGA